MKRFLIRNAKVFIVFVCVMAVANFASADIIRGINIDFVTIHNVGNAADTTGYGAVDHSYRIGKSEVTNAQWNAFTTAAGVPTGNDGGYNYNAVYTGVQQPANNVSWYEATQFCNYLTSGDKSKGVYQFSGNNANPGNFLGIDRTEALASYGKIFALATEDEWYKAAYYKPDGSGYSLYANGTNTAPVAGVDTNYNYQIGNPWNAGSGTMEQNGTFDMMGNVWEWNETIIGSNRDLRGGSYGDIAAYIASSGIPVGGLDPSGDYGGFVGFRVVGIPNPEPATICMLGLGVWSLIHRKK